jgi:hypothetical protein
MWPRYLAVAAVALPARAPAQIVRRGKVVEQAGAAGSQ